MPRIQAGNVTFVPYSVPFGQEIARTMAKLPWETLHFVEGGWVKRWVGENNTDSTNGILFKKLSDW